MRSATTAARPGKGARARRGVNLLGSLSGLLVGSLALGADSTPANASSTAGEEPRARVQHSACSIAAVDAFHATGAVEPLSLLDETSSTAGFLRIAGASGPTPNLAEAGAFDVTAFGPLGAERSAGALPRRSLGVAIPSTEASAAVYLDSATSRLIPTVELEFVARRTSRPKPLLTIRLTNAVLRAVDAGNFSAAIGATSTLLLSFSFAGIALESQATDADLGAAPNRSALGLNTASGGPPGFADSVLHSLTGLSRNARGARALLVSRTEWSD